MPPADWELDADLRADDVLTDEELEEDWRQRRKSPHRKVWPGFDPDDPGPMDASDFGG